MFVKKFLISPFWFILVQLIKLTHPTFHDSGHGFMTKKSRYFEDELSHIHGEIGSLRYLQNVNSLTNLNLRFDPEFLDFSDRSLGSPHSRTVTLFNTDGNKSIDLTSISGNTVHFHSSFFEDKQIPPNGNTSFKVVYLGRQEGPVESSLFLHTSNGFVKYNVKAFGIFNSYRVRPIVGVKLPVNSTFTPVIYMHNPHSEPIQIVEIYTSGGGFHLELPSGQHEGPNDLWEINPHETKAVIRVRFEAKVPHNHTAYIRIKLHNPEEILIVPLEVEVTPIQSIFHPQGYIDFGVGGSMDEPKEVNLCLHNPMKRAVRVHSVSTLSKSIKTHYYNTRISPITEQENACVSVGTLTIDWKRAWQAQDYHGKIIVKFRNGKNRTEIPYFLTVLKGGLSYDKMSTIYFLNEKEMDTKERKFLVSNEFFHSVRVLDVKFPFDMDTTFKVETFTPLTIKAFEKKALFNIWLKSSAKKTDMQLTSHIKVLTNVSEISVPLLSYNGKLQIHLPFPSDDRSLNVGLIGHNEKMQLVFTLTNPNPVDLLILQLKTSLPMSELELCGCGVGDHRNVIMHNSFGNLTKCDKITAQGFAVVKMAISTSDIDGQMRGDVQIQTPFENLSLPVHYKVAAGAMIIDQDDLVFDNCFPAKTCIHPLRIFSSFSEKMSVENILTLPPDKRVSAAIISSILPKVNNVIGHMYFNPDVDCSPECYTGFVSEGSASWLRTMAISKQVSEYDMKLVNTFYGRFLNFTKNGSKTVDNINLRLDTTEVKGKMFVSKVNYTWPSIVRHNGLKNSTLEFPLTQVRNSSYRTLTLHNPANHSLVVQLLFENDYPHADMLYDGLPSSFVPPSNVKYTSANWFSFDKRTMDNQQFFFVDNLKVNVYKHSLPFILLPGQSKKVSLEFTAEEPRPYSGLLLIRNNLTVLEIVRLNGKGTIPRFEFAMLQPGDLKPLHFELTEKHMRACNQDLNQKPYLPNLTVKESFLAKNLGEIPVQVTSFSISGHQCEGFGFQVLNCDPFTLPPNSSRRIDLAFTPDLTLQEVSRVLIIGTSLNSYVNYSLKATVSRNYCRHCGVLLPRPSWEICMSYVVNVFLTFMLLVVFAVAIMDANSIKAKAVEVYLASNNPSMLPVLDLRKVGRQVREEIQSSLKDSTKSEPTPSPKLEDGNKSEPAIIPTTGKAKRKLIQSNSINEQENSMDDDSERERVRETKIAVKKKDILFERHRLKSRERKTEKELKLLEDKGRKDKHAQQKESLFEVKKGAAPKKTVRTSVTEEESSSTTTESSSSSAICDDKENQALSRWSSKQKTVNVSSQTLASDVTANQKEAQDSKIKHVSFVNSKLKVKPVNTPPSHAEHDKERKVLGDRSSEAKTSLFAHTETIREKRRRDGKFKDRKDKSIFRYKSHSDRKHQHTEFPDTLDEKDTIKSPTGFYVSLPMISGTTASWCENRARFSDVVARSEHVIANDSSSTSPRTSNSLSMYSESEHAIFKQEISSSPFKHNKCSGKPTMYVEPYKPIDLGPIGSKRLGTPDSHSPDLFTSEAVNYPTQFHPMNDKSIIAAVANSGYLPNKTTYHEQDSSSEDVGMASIDRWQRHQVFRDLTGSREDAGLFGTTEFKGPDESSWRNVSTRTTVPVQTATTTDYWSNTFSTILNSTSKVANNTSYLWGSNPIWEPWHPPVGSPVRRTPPGFDEHIQKKRTEEEQKRFQQQQQNNQYNPFRSPWTQPWEH
ncbi:transmembrane protein 131 [Euwallacea similis]|uniref:transmembrane protein 131 n=1 Tax=Euwallacea similis TaxID=1736056 RepID=UPI00344D7CDB